MKDKPDKIDWDKTVAFGGNEIEQPSEKLDYGFLASCVTCDKIGFVHIPSKAIVSQKILNELRKLEDEKGLSYQCDRCTTLEETPILENPPKWLDVLEKDGNFIFVAKKRSVDFIKYHGFRKVNR